jgi:plastocyanin
MTGDSQTRRSVLNRVATTGAAAIGVGLAGCSGGGGGGDDDDGGDGNGDGTTVDMTDDLVFDPEDITVSAGTTVTWENVGTVAHTVTAYEDEIPSDATYFASGGFDSEEAARSGYPGEGAIEGGETYEHTFETTGTYEYFCIPHESTMVGTVVVE